MISAVYRILLRTTAPESPDSVYLPPGLSRQTNAAPADRVAPPFGNRTFGGRLARKDGRWLASFPA